MATAKYYSLHELDARIDGEKVTVAYDPEFGPGSLDDCVHHTFQLSEAVTDEPGDDAGEYGRDVFTFTVNENAKLIVYSLHRDQKIRFGTGAYVISLDRNALGKNIYACPVCLNQEGLKAFPPVAHLMSPDGEISQPGDATEEYGDTTETLCPCGYYGRRLTFDTELWEEHEDS